MPVLIWDRPFLLGPQPLNKQTDWEVTFITIHKSFPYKDYRSGLKVKLLHRQWILRPCLNLWIVPSFHEGCAEKNTAFQKQILITISFVLSSLKYRQIICLLEIRKSKNILLLNSNVYFNFNWKDMISTSFNKEITHSSKSAQFLNLQQEYAKNF